MVQCNKTGVAPKKLCQYSKASLQRTQAGCEDLGIFRDAEALRFHTYKTN
jgi:hypothetical protein